MSEEAWRGETPKEPKRSFEQEMLELLEGEPFAPFSIVMDSGREFMVSSPYSLVVGNTFYTVYKRDGTSRLRISSISSIDIPEGS